MQLAASSCNLAAATLRASPRRPRQLTTSCSSSSSEQQYRVFTRRSVLLVGLALAGASLAGGVQPAPSAAADLGPEFLAALDDLALMPEDRKWIEQLKASVAREARVAECAAAAPPPGQFVPVSGAAAATAEPAAELASGGSVLSLFDSVPLTPEDQEWLGLLKAAEARRAGAGA